MKRYEWYSELAPERVRARLLVRGRPWKSPWDTYDERQLLVKFLPDGQFFLLKTGGMWQMRPSLPFVGMVTPWEAGSLIAGDFQVPHQTWKGAAILGGVILVVAMAFGIPIQIALPTVSLFLGIWYGLIQAVGGDPSIPQHQETLAFIETELLRE